MASIWSETRRSGKQWKGESDHRIPFEHDYDRLLFSTPVRRLADKTQVFPLDKSDAVRTRLTHSHEVANLARSMGNRLIHGGFDFPGLAETRAIPSILATIGLAHDLGNPPFGHQGEAAIGHWFKNKDVFGDASDASTFIPEHLWGEFLEFEGNAQALRILARLQVALGGYGLDLTAGTLAALMKYPTPVDRRDKGNAATKKFGYFEAEHDVVQWVRLNTGLSEAQRHPLTWLMEAADDIAYATLDIEDAMHKGIISPDDVRAIIGHDLETSYKKLRAFLDEKFIETRKKEGLSIREIREVMSSYLRTAFIDGLISEAIDVYKSDSRNIFAYSRTTPLLKESGLLKSMKELAKKHVFSHPSITKIEADGYRILEGLMDFYWYAITNRENDGDLLSDRTDAKAAFGISKISDNYLQCAARANYLDRDNAPLSMRYKELRLLTDMVSGMSDGFAKSEYDFLRQNEMIAPWS
jgi:dGTPase